MRNLLLLFFVLWSSLCHSQLLNEYYDVKNVLLNGIHLNDSLSRCFDVLGMPSEVFMYDVPPFHENTPPSLNRYKYGENEILSNIGSLEGDYFTGFIIKDSLYPFVVTLYSGKSQPYEIVVGSHFDAKKVESIYPYLLKSTSSPDQHDYGIRLGGLYVPEFRNTYLNIKCNGNDIVQLIEVIYEVE